MVLQSVKALEDPVMEELLTQLIPDMLNRVELGRIRGQPQKIDIGRRFERIAAVPASTVNHHDDALLGVACRDFVEEQLHALGVDVRQDQAASSPVHTSTAP